MAFRLPCLLLCLLNTAKVFVRNKITHGFIRNFKSSFVQSKHPWFSQSTAELLRRDRLNENGDLASPNPAWKHYNGPFDPLWYLSESRNNGDPPLLQAVSFDRVAPPANLPQIIGTYDCPLKDKLSSIVCPSKAQWASEIIAGVEEALFQLPSGRKVGFSTVRTVD